ncbi:MAG: YgiQ family radical SAM protein [Candidatus Cloacimonadales bacterium]|nr:YgiQ family radical SAM protein [Candidatus Cloacimonadales bacterium]
MKHFLPTSKAEMQVLGWQQLDIIIISGDAYVDHPSFGPILIARVLEAKGYKVGIISQPDWKTDADFTRLGKPRLFFGISSGNMDSMINHYTAQKKLRSSDAYSPAGKAGLRPNRATIVYSQKIRALFKDAPIVLGGIEASLRRMPHYDFWSDKVRNSILFDSRADILVYGMGERAIIEIAAELNKGENISELTGIRGTVVSSSHDSGELKLPEFSDKNSPKDFLKFNKLFYENFNTKVISYPFAGKYLIHNLPAKPLSTKELDDVFDLPFTRLPHPSYQGKKIPAFEQIKDSITSHRGCFGGCNFCAIGAHQGKTIQSRSQNSILQEIRELTERDYFKGTISDVGGPTANMYGNSCNLNIAETCKRRSCLYPEICPHLDYSAKSYKKLLKKANSTSGVNHVFISSGIRFDLALDDDDFIFQIADLHTKGLLKLAPEHKSEKVLEYMNKPAFYKYQQFVSKYSKISRELGKQQFILPYIIVGHPGATLHDTIELAVYLKKNNIKLKQVQEFTPTPMSISTLMYYTGFDLEMRKIHVPKGREIRLMKALVQWFEPDNKKLVIEVLIDANRKELINFFLE